MSFRLELLELKKQHHIQKRADIKEEVAAFFREHKVRIEDAMKMSAKSGYINAAYYLFFNERADEMVAIHNTKTRDLFTKHICELLEFEYPDIKFDGRGNGEIVISWEE